MEKKCALKDEIIEELNQKLESAVSNEAYKNSIQQLDGMKEYVYIQNFLHLIGDSINQLQLKMRN